LVPYDAILSEEAQNSRTKATYQRFPIRDISVPSDPDHLAEIPRSIVASVREGRSTCTVGVAWVALGLVACWLQEHGQTPGDALAVECEMEHG
jgi:hypothetical protein